jgi:hypothetical protein
MIGTTTQKKKGDNDTFHGSTIMLGPPVILARLPLDVPARADTDPGAGDDAGRT